MTEEEIEAHFARNGEEAAKELKQEKTKEDGNNIKPLTVEETLKMPKKTDREKGAQVKDKAAKKKRKKDKLKVGKVKKVIKKRKKYKRKDKPAVEQGKPRIPLQEKLDKAIVKKSTRAKGMNGQSAEQKLVQKKLADFMSLDKSEAK
eukprot:TRINITY_DN6969_c0_g1_i2.p7 TRINITY_DN6969_c0_g1~~TRINITY_DN6969_c0_g1_i2.p7  ORF type:complete len:147 (+),score=73.05 TRINITY_DN6969_c0_g1_i2:2513-2953(+)